jgi:hypothetical protein
MLVGMAGDSLASDLTTEHYAQIEQQRGIMTELGEIAGGGLGYTRAQRFGGAAAVEAARSLGMDVQHVDEHQKARFSGHRAGRSLTSRKVA